MPITVNNNGSLKTLNNIYSNVNGALKTISAVHTNVSGFLKQIYSNFPSDLTGTVSGSGNGTITTIGNNIVIPSSCSATFKLTLTKSAPGGGALALYYTKDGGSIITVVSGKASSSTGTVSTKTVTLSDGTYMFYAVIGGYTSTGQTTSSTADYSITFSH